MTAGTGLRETSRPSLSARTGPCRLCHKLRKLRRGPPGAHRCRLCAMSNRSDFSGAVTSRRKASARRIVHAPRPAPDPSDEEWPPLRAVGLVDVLQDSEVKAFVAGNAAQLLHQGLVPLLCASEDPEACAIDTGACPATALAADGRLAAGDQCVALCLVVCEDPVGPGRDSTHGWQETRANQHFCRVRCITVFGTKEASTVTGLAIRVLRVVVDLHRPAHERRLGEDLVLGVDAVVP